MEHLIAVEALFRKKMLYLIRQMLLKVNYFADDKGKSQIK